MKTQLSKPARGRGSYTEEYKQQALELWRASGRSAAKVAAELGIRPPLLYFVPRLWTPSMEGLGLGFVANHFDVVPVRTNDESCIVVRVVVRAQTRRTIVFATRLQSRAIESFDLLAILGRERQVKMRRLLLGLVQAQ